MLKALAASALLLAAAPVTAEDCSSGLIEVAEWSAASTGSAIPYVEGSVSIDMLLTTSGDPIEMVDGSVVFSDVLGREIGTVPIDPDAKLAAGRPFRANDRYPPSALDRLPAVAPHRVTAAACLRSVLFADGTVRRFD